ncbi:bifunctional metallophosphatase/5'-nucleotidase [Vibrio sp. LaRot3]|uniref:bifunctional metallophosphatase/5'-nucleotidase n=1 Tax=Vibrio sp. LaRot3 TaxID=2998829 RepID=UPI0022CDE965|nr:5'-nucleotidase C-terminal domain-containing protein [Vibrio sp. LaRot3]MDA0148315.1 5'-nucleotidase C-terminal domain-containing protein [Vibrio sp. LaRot3]
MTERKNKATRIKLAHINDTHSYFEPTSLQLSLPSGSGTETPFVSAGGFARIATRAKQLRQQAEENEQGFLFLHAGDCFQGTLYFSLFKGEANSTMLNQLGLDAMAVGNHELDMGNLPVAQFAKQIDFPLLAGNWDLSKECEDKPERLSGNPNVFSFRPYSRSAQWIVKHIGDEAIAIFSLTLDKMADISNPDADTPFVSAIETARNTVCEIHRAGINKIILLSHMGYDTDLDFANHVGGISIIVGGHSHVLQGDFSQLGLGKSDEYGVKVNQTYVVQAGYHALALGHCDIEFDEQGTVARFNGKNELLIGRRLFIDTSRSQSWQQQDYQALRAQIENHPNVMVCHKDNQIQKLLQERYQSRVRALQQTILATASNKLRHIRVPDEQGGSEIAPLVSQSFQHAMIAQGYEIDFAIHNAGGVRTSINPGPISVADIAGKVLPFAVPIGVYRIKGEFIRATLEDAINNALSNGVKGTGDGSYPYTANLRFDYDATAPMGQRIESLEIYRESTGWQPIDDHHTYTGTSSAYTMKGKEGYEAILNMQGEGEVTTLSMADCFIQYLKDKPEILSCDSVAYRN